MKRSLASPEDYQRNLLATQNNNKNVLFQVKQLPDDCFKYVFSYSSLMPFDKKDFSNYHKTKVLNYSLLHDPYRDTNNCRAGDYLVGFKKKHYAHIVHIA